jgi:hypothetical protein
MGLNSAWLRILVAVPLVLTSTAATSINTNHRNVRSDSDKAITSQPESCRSIIQFDPRRFNYPTRIDNQFLPLVPGTQLVYEGRSSRSGQPLPHRVVFTVSDFTKVVNGVRSLVIWDRDIEDGVIVEAELAFQAQDDAGNVWNLGEYPEEFEDGEFVGAPNTWIAGVSGALPGIAMLAKPKPGTPRYLQGFSPDIDFLDCAGVFAHNERVCVPVDCFKHVLVTDENSPLDPEGGHQRKFYAPGVGNIQVTAVDDPEGETLVLTSVVRLGPQAMVEVRDAVLRLERRAYRISAVYRQTPPVERL